MSTPLPSGVVTLVFTDIEGHSELWERYRAAFHSTLVEHNRLVRVAITRWGGVEIKTEGDSFFIVFHRASDAVQFAVDVQRTLLQHDWRAPADSSGEPITLRVRIGLHTGEPLLIHHPDGQPDYFG